MTATFDDVRRIGLGLPETEEVLTWGTDVTFRVRSKIFVIGRTAGTRLDQIDADRPGRPDRS